MRFHLSLLLVCVAGLGWTGPALAAASPPADAAELALFQGHWRATELVEDGRAVAADAIRNWLPSGGQIQIIENTILFVDRLTGQKRAKTFSIDPTVFPKTIAIMTRDKTEGWGIYQFEGGRLIMCIADPATAPRPTDFSARAGSKRMLLTIEKNDPSSKPPGAAGSGGPLQPVPTPPANPPAAQPPAQPPAVIPTPVPPPVPAGITSRVVTDAEVRAMLPGVWRLNDGVGIIDLTVMANGTFFSSREVRNVSTYYQVFGQTPVSNGTWSVNSGQLQLHITSSIYAARVNRVMPLAVRSISATDLILVDALGRVIRAVKAR